MFTYQGFVPIDTSFTSSYAEGYSVNSYLTRNSLSSYTWASATHSGNSSKTFNSYERFTQSSVSRTSSWEVITGPNPITDTTTSSSSTYFTALEGTKIYYECGLYSRSWGTSETYGTTRESISTKTYGTGIKLSTATLSTNTTKSFSYSPTVALTSSVIIYISTTSTNSFGSSCYTFIPSSTIVNTTITNSLTTSNSFNALTTTTSILTVDRNAVDSTWVSLTYSIYRVEDSDIGFVPSATSDAVNFLTNVCSTFSEIWGPTPKTINRRYLTLKSSQGVFTVPTFTYNLAAITTYTLTVDYFTTQNPEVTVTEIYPRSTLPFGIGTSLSYTEGHGISVDSSTYTASSFYFIETIVSANPSTSGMTILPSITSGTTLLRPTTLFTKVSTMEGRVFRTELLRKATGYVDYVTYSTLDTFCNTILTLITSTSSTENSTATVEFTYFGHANMHGQTTSYTETITMGFSVSSLNTISTFCPIFANGFRIPNAMRDSDPIYLALEHELIDITFPVYMDSYDGTASYLIPYRTVHLTSMTVDTKCIFGGFFSVITDVISLATHQSSNNVVFVASPHGEEDALTYLSTYYTTDGTATIWGPFSFTVKSFLDSDTFIFSFTNSKIVNLTNSVNSWYDSFTHVGTFPHQLFSYATETTSYSFSFNGNNQVIASTTVTSYEGSILGGYWPVTSTDGNYSISNSAGARFTIGQNTYEQVAQPGSTNGNKGITVYEFLPICLNSTTNESSPKILYFTFSKHPDSASTAIT